MAKLDEKEVQEIYESVLNDYSLFSTIDIDELLEGIDEDKYENLEDYTMGKINQEIFNVVNNMNIVNKEEVCNKLIGYKYINDLNELNVGRHVRWIKHGNNKLTNGGILVNFKFLDNGTHLTIMNMNRRFSQIKIDSCDIFQKLLPEEQIVLMAYEHLEEN